MWKFYEKKMGVFFLFHFLWKGHVTCKSVKSGIVEGAITQYLSIIKHILTSSKKIAHLFFHEICTVWRVNAVVHSVKVSNQGAVYFFKCPIPQCFRNKGARSPLNIFSGDRIYPLGLKIMYPYKKCIELHIFVSLNTHFS